MNFLAKLVFLWKKPKVVVVAGNGRLCAAEAIFQVLKQNIEVDPIRKFSISNGARKIQKIGIGDVFSNKTLVFPSAVDNPKEIIFLLKNSRLPILVITAVGELPPDKALFAADLEDVKEIRKVAEEMPVSGHLILNFDDETIRETKSRNKEINCLSFGLQNGADCQASDIIVNNGTNFKLNYKGNTIPVWLGKLFGKEQIYSALSAACVGIILGLNLVEISQALKTYQSLPGKMRLIEGIKQTYILDDSENTSPYSMAEALEILGKIKLEGLVRPNFPSENLAGRKIAVLGDIIGIGKYTIEAHEAMGERTAKNVDLLFTVGARAKFIAEGSLTKGMGKDKIFQFDEVDGAKMALQKEMKKGDLILIDGSKEMKMEKIVEEIKS